MDTMKTALNRRRFLKSSILGASGIVAGAAVVQAQGIYIDSDEKDSVKMIYRKLGNTGLKLPILSMGVMRADNPNLVRAALDKGIVHLDTANSYQHGRNEEMLGELLKDYPRDSFVLATKIGVAGKDRKTGLYGEEATEEDFMKKFDVSMKRLGLDYVDILYHHAISTREAALHEPILNAMKKVKESGRVRHLGISTHRNEPEVIMAAIESGVYEVVLTAYNFKQEHMKEIEEAIKKASDAGLGVVAMKTLAGGFLDKERKQAINAKAALKWALKNPNVHTSILGFTSFDQLDEDLSIFKNMELTEDEKKDILLAQTSQGLYCTGCEECLDQCKKGLNIPDLMRAYMYTYGYRELARAKDLVTELNLPSDVCSDCGECTVHCTKGFSVAERIKDVHRILEVPSDFIV